MIEANFINVDTFIATSIIRWNAISADICVVIGIGASRYSYRKIVLIGPTGFEFNTEATIITFVYELEMILPIILDIINTKQNK